MIRRVVRRDLEGRIEYAELLADPQTGSFQVVRVLSVPR